MAYIDTPDYPVISWEITLEESVVISLEGDFGSGTVSSSVTLPAGDYSGFDVDASSVCQPTSLWGAVGALIEAELQNPATFNQATATVTVTREWRTNILGSGSEVGDYLATLIAVGSTASPVTTFKISFPSAAVGARFGVGASGIFLPALGAPFESYNDFNSEGYWSPRQLTVVETRDIQSTVFSNQNLTGATVDVVRWGNDRIRSVMTFPYVYAAYIWAYRAGRVEFSEPAGRYSFDPNNLLETLKSVATQTGTPEFLFFQEAGKRARITLPSVEGLRNLENLISEDVSGNGQLLQVTLPHNIIEKLGGFD